MGMDVVKVNKANGSVNFSIEKINENRFFITSSSKNGIKELESYIWAKDVNGMPLNSPEKKLNHFVDGMRYTELGIAPIETNYYVY
jgi:phage terminase large subunit